MPKTPSQNALQQINEGIEAHLVKLDSKARAERHKAAIGYASNLASQPRAGKVRRTVGIRASRRLSRNGAGKS